MSENSDQREKIPPEEQPEEINTENGQHRRPYTVMRGVQTVFSIAVVMATLLTLWNPRRMLRPTSLDDLLRQAEIAKTDEAESGGEGGSQIGILSGYWQNTTGEVCADGLVESEVNYLIASLTAQILIDEGYDVKIFPEYDLALLNFKGKALVALYSGSCAENPKPPSGFKIESSPTTEHPDLIDQFAVCLADKYRETTGLNPVFNVINPDHPSYHIFRDIDPETPAVRIEMGSLMSDRHVLIENPEAAASGIAEGIICFLESRTGD